MSTSSESDASSEFEEEPTLNTIISQEQWVQRIEFCSYKSNFNESVPRKIGVEKLCGSTDDGFGEKTENSWIFYPNSRQESLVVSFETPVFINEIDIYESINPGSVITLEALETERNKWWTMWQRKTSTKRQSTDHNIFKPLLRRYHIQSNVIRITFDPSYTDRIGIQAIKLNGSNIFDAQFNFKTISQSMAKLYDDAMKNLNTDVKFGFGDKIVSAHRNILCCRCAYFRSLLLLDFIEKTQKTPIILTDIDYETFLEILYFIYTGKYHSTITVETTINAMMYAQKINFTSAKNAAMETLCRHLRIHHESVLMIYGLAKTFSPAYDLLLDYIYDLCSEYLSEICKQETFMSLEKDSMIDIICRSTERREAREQEKLQQMTNLQNNVIANALENEEE